MTKQKTCERCGANLESQATISGLCPRCLMMAGMGQDSTPRGAWEPPSIEELAPHFPQLELHELVGRGGAGAVYRAHQKSLGRDVALKVMPQAEPVDPIFAERFEREARVLAQLDHPGIVQVFDAGKSGPYYYLIMEYVDGANIRQMLRTGSVEPKAALKAVGQICEALQFAHDRGVVHRDIKPENILVDKAGSVRIADFGLAKIVSGGAENLHLTRTDQAMGTPHYMAPEQYEQPLEVDHRADIYSLGVVFYELLTGEVPMGSFEPPSERAAVDGRLDDVVLKTLQRDPDRRYQRADQINTDLDNMGEARAHRPAGSADQGPAPSDEKASTPLWKVLGCLLLSVGCLLPLLGIFAVLLFGVAAPMASSLSGPEQPIPIEPLKGDQGLVSSWIGFGGGQPALNAEVVGVLGLDAAGELEANQVLQDAWAQYLFFEDEARSVNSIAESRSNPGATPVLTFDIKCFAPDRLELDAQVIEGLSRLLNEEQQQLLQHDFDPGQLFPFGNVIGRVRVSGPDEQGRYCWTDFGDAFGGLENCSSSLPGTWEHLLDLD